MRRTATPNLTRKRRKPHTAPAWRWIELEDGSDVLRRVEKWWGFPLRRKDRYSLHKKNRKLRTEHGRWVAEQKRLSFEGMMKAFDDLTDSMLHQPRQKPYVLLVNGKAEQMFRAGYKKS